MTVNKVWVNPAHGSEASRRALRAAGNAVESSEFRRARPRQLRKPKVYNLDAIGKNDPWAANLETPVVPEYRGRKANYRSGTASVGKRYSGASTGTGGPKKVQPTRVAGRKTPGAGITMRDESQPPIDASLIGKSSSYTDIPNAHRGRTISVTDPKGRTRRLHVRSHEHGAAMQGLERGIRGYQGAQLGSALTQNRSSHTQRVGTSVGAAVGASLPPTRRSTTHRRADGWWKPTGVTPGSTSDQHATELRLRRHSRKERRFERGVNTAAGAVSGAALGGAIGQATTRGFGAMSRRRLATSLGLGALGGAAGGFAISPRHHSLEYRRPKNKPVRKVYTEHNGHEWRDDDGNWGHGPSPIPNASKRVRRFTISRGGNQVGKRDRRYNPEHNRQRRLGAAAVGLGAGGALLTHRGVSGVRAAGRLARHHSDRAAAELEFVGHPHYKLNRIMRNEKGVVVSDKVEPFGDRHKAALEVLQETPHQMVGRPSRRQMRQIGGGAALMAAGAGTAGYSRSRANREWR